MGRWETFLSTRLGWNKLVGPYVNCLVQQEQWHLLCSLVNSFWVGGVGRNFSSSVWEQASCTCPFEGVCAIRRSQRLNGRCFSLFQPGIQLGSPLNSLRQVWIFNNKEYFCTKSMSTVASGIFTQTKLLLLSEFKFYQGTIICLVLVWLFIIPQSVTG